MIDREYVQEYVRDFAPYSDFNFTSLWSWDTHSLRGLSMLDGNLIVRFTDYNTADPFYSIIGKSNINDAVLKLIAQAQSEGMSQTLKLIPEEVAKEVYSPALVVKEDRDYFDYVYSIELLASFPGNSYKKKRELARRFMREHPNARYEIANLAEVAVQEQLLATFHHWETERHTHVPNEETALRRICDLARYHSLELGAIFEGDQILSFTIDELLSNGVVMGHFWKARYNIPGIYDVLAQKMALHLQSQGGELWNWEQDLGILNLRYAKQSFRPTHLLKRYTIERRHA